MEFFCASGPDLNFGVNLDNIFLKIQLVFIGDLFRWDEIATTLRSFLDDFGICFTSCSHIFRTVCIIYTLKTPCGVHTAAPRILARRFVAVGAVLRSAKFGAVCRCVFCVFGRFLAGSWQVLGGSWLFLAVLGPLSSKTESHKHEAWGGKKGTQIDENEVLGVSGGLWDTSRLQECKNGVTPEFLGPILAPFWGPFFARSALWSPLGGSVSRKRKFGGGPKMESKTRAKTYVKVEPFWY